MKKIKRKLKDNIVTFPKKLNEGEREVEAIIFAGSLELVKEGNLTIKQENLFDEIYVKEIKWLK